MKRGFSFGVILLAAAGLFLSACRPLMENQEITPTAGSGILKTHLPPDAITFDILIVHVPYQDRELIERLWQEVDEQELDPKMRAELNRNGFRAGIFGATVPDALADLMSLKGRALRSSVEEKNLPASDSTAPMTLSKIETLQPGHKCMIATGTSPVDKIPVVSVEKDGLTGKTYRNAETKLSIMVRPVPDGSVRFEITPFLTFGQNELITRYKYGQIVRAYEQPTKTFDELCCNLPLRPGQFLVIGPSRRDATGLGRYFFTQGNGDFEQKIVVLRLLFTQHDERFRQFPGFQEILDRRVAEEKSAQKQDEPAPVVFPDEKPENEKKSKKESLWSGTLDKMEL